MSTAHLGLLVRKEHRRNRQFFVTKTSRNTDPKFIIRRDHRSLVDRYSTAVSSLKKNVTRPILKFIVNCSLVTCRIICALMTARLERAVAGFALRKTIGDSCGKEGQENPTPLMGSVPAGTKIRTQVHTHHGINGAIQLGGNEEQTEIRLLGAATRARTIGTETLLVRPLGVSRSFLRCVRRIPTLRRFIIDSPLSTLRPAVPSSARPRRR